MKYLSLLQLACLADAVLLALALFPMPYGYYLFLRLATTIVAVVLAYQFYKHSNSALTIVAIVVAILFQPIWKIPMDRVVWMVVDAIVAAALAIGVFTKKI